MVLVVIYKNGNKLCEEIRTVEVNNAQLIYYRKSYYTGGQLLINVSEIDHAYMINHGETINLIAK